MADSFERREPTTPEEHLLLRCFSADVSEGVQCGRYHSRQSTLSRRHIWTSAGTCALLGAHFCGISATSTFALDKVERFHSLAFVANRPHRRSHTSVKNYKALILRDQRTDYDVAVAPTLPMPSKRKTKDNLRRGRGASFDECVSGT